MGMYENIKMLCKRDGITVKHMEEVLDITRSSTCKWSKNPPTLTSAMKVANYFNVSLDYLLADKEGKYSVDVAAENAAANKDKQTKRILKYLDALSQEQKDVVESMIAGIVNNKKE